MELSQRLVKFRRSGLFNIRAPKEPRVLKAIIT